MGGVGNEAGSGNASGGSTNGTGGKSASGGSSGGPDHAMYFLGESVGGDGYDICDLATGDSVAHVSLLSPNGFVDPKTGHLLYHENASSSVKDAQTKGDRGIDCLTGFTMLPDSTLVSRCDPTPPCPNFIRDDLGNSLCDDLKAVFDSDGVQHSLIGDIPKIYAMRTKPGGGFWALGGAFGSGAMVLTRWSISVTGDATLDGEYAVPDDLEESGEAFALDADGSAYTTGVTKASPASGAVVRFSADFASTQIVITDASSDCKLLEDSGWIYSTP